MASILPIILVAFQLAVLGWTSARLWRDSSPVFRVLWLAALCGVIGGLDVWYLGYHAYPNGFSL